MRRVILKWMLCQLIGCFLWLAAISMHAAEPGQPISAAERAASRNIFGCDPTPEFIKFDPEYPQKHRLYAQQLRELQLELARQAVKGRATPCSRQIFLEARWLVFYSAHWDRIQRRLGDLRNMLSRPSDPPDARDQVEADGSY